IVAGNRASSIIYGNLGIPRDRFHRGCARDPHPAPCGGAWAYDSHSRRSGHFRTLTSELWPETGPSAPARSRRVFMTNGNGTPQEGAPPQLNVLAQYTKDLSFENPNAPSSLQQQQQQQPQINIQINVSANNIAQNEFEVTLHIDGKAENSGKVLFSF